jgi:hypothetical protein
MSRGRRGGLGGGRLKLQLHLYLLIRTLTMMPAMVGYMPGNLVYTRMLALLMSTYQMSV